LDNYKLLKSKDKIKLEVITNKYKKDFYLFNLFHNVSIYFIKKKTLREIAHLRPRTNINSCIMRIRSSLSILLHEFFQGAGFLLVNTPIITKLDHENKNELFQISTLSDEIKSEWINLFDKISSINSEVHEKISLSDLWRKINKQKNKNKNENNFEKEKEKVKENFNLFIENLKETTKLNSPPSSLNYGNDINNNENHNISLDLIKGGSFSNFSLEDFDYILDEKENNNSNKKNGTGNETEKITSEIEKNNNKNPMEFKDLIVTEEIKNEIEDNYILINSFNKDKNLNFIYDKIFSKVNKK